MSKELTLEDLANSMDKKVSEADVFTPSTMKELSSEELIANRMETHPDEYAAEEESKKVVDTEIVANALSGMHKTIDEKIAGIEAAKEQAAAELEEDELNKELEELGEEVKSSMEDDDFSDLDEESDTEEESNEKESSVDEDDEEEEITKPDYDDSTIDEFLNDIDDEESSTEDDDFNIDEEETVEEIRERFKKTMASIIVPVKNPVNIAEFRIRKKPMSSLNSLKNVSSNKKKYDWVLFNTKRSITLEECDGAELEALNKSVNNRNNTNAIIDTLRFIYDHVVDANKPSFDTWTKSICSDDLDSLLFCLYAACYSDSNLVARKDVDGCEKTSLVDTPILDMVKFADSDAEEEFNELRRQDTTSHSNTIKAKMYQMSDDYVISYLPSTLYSLHIQNSTLPKKILEKYPDIVGMLTFIDDIYKIDRESQELIPIEIKEYPNNVNKTVMSKIKTLLTILKTLSPDQYAMLTGVLVNANGTPKISYVLPKCECPECHKTIKEDSIPSILQMLFTRAQLAQIRNS